MYQNPCPRAGDADRGIVGAATSSALHSWVEAVKSPPVALRSDRSPRTTSYDVEAGIAGQERSLPRISRSAEPEGGTASSITPLQSLSRPSQVSGVGAAGTALQIVPEPSAEQNVTPGVAHCPTPETQASPTAKPLSLVPSQSLSSPSQLSGAGGAGA